MRPDTVSAKSDDACAFYEPVAEMWKHAPCPGRLRPKSGAGRRVFRVAAAPTGQPVGKQQPMTFEPAIIDQLTSTKRTDKVESESESKCHPSRDMKRLQVPC